MSLITLWKGNKKDIESKEIQQLVGLAGDGKLKDNSVCSKEIQEYFSYVSIELLATYIEQCLAKSFTNSGLVLQDLINEIGRRLDFEVENGLYQGRTGKVGFDGLWKSPEGFSIVIEVKTTDAYRMQLNTLSEYRKKLIESSTINTDSSILIVVGRDDTGELEAQVRGSRHAWDIRIIGTEQLLSLAKIKISSEEDTGEKMRQLLRPIEYTRLDKLVDIVYTTAQDVEEVADSENLTKTDEDGKQRTSTWEFTDSKVLDAKRNEIIKRLGEFKESALIKKTRATYWSSDHKLRVACTVSKPYEREGQRYWYAYHPRWDEFLKDGDDSYLVLGCMDLDIAFAIPRDIIQRKLDYLNPTVKANGKKYWHIIISEPQESQYELYLSKGEENLPINQYKF